MVESRNTDIIIRTYLLQVVMVSFVSSRLTSGAIHLITEHTTSITQRYNVYYQLVSEGSVRSNIVLLSGNNTL